MSASMLGIILGTAAEILSLATRAIASWSDAPPTAAEIVARARREILSLREDIAGLDQSEQAALDAAVPPKA